MTNAYIDENERNTLTAWNETTGEIEPLYVDPVTGALLVYAVSISSPTVTAFDRAGIDDNSRNTLSAWNDTTGSVEALRCDSSGNLLVMKV
ncbi:MAG TPA: hypothetical protein VG961_09485 [Ignavibacteria bacterium]|nr:hypothetical protein [Ignavibacteria bacterium]